MTYNNPGPGIVDPTKTIAAPYSQGNVEVFGTANVGTQRQARSVLYAYTHVRTWSDQKILKFLAIVSILNILLVRNEDFVMKAPLWLNSKN